MIRCLFCALLLLAMAGAARAHDPGMTVATIIVDAGQTTVEISIKGADLALAAGLELLDADGLVDPQRLERASPAIGDHLRAVTAIEAAGVSCPLALDGIAAAADGVLVILHSVCGSSTGRLVYRTRLLHQTRPGTIQNVLLVKGDDATSLALNRTGNSLELGQPVPRLAVFSRYVVSGAGHIFIGFDHLAFLLALLLWARRFWTVVKVVTAFTLAHTVTLSLAALDVVAPSPSLVEPLIAVTIIAAAAENFFNRDVERRWKTALVLGLVHGFGFAGALTAMGLPRDALLIALVSFNIGVEIGQLAVVALMLSALILIDRMMSAGSEAARRPALVYGLSAPIALLGAWWLIERTVVAWIP